MARARRRKASESSYAELELALTGPAHDWSAADLDTIPEGPFKTAFAAEHRAWIEAGRPELGEWLARH